MKVFELSDDKTVLIVNTNQSRWYLQRDAIAFVRFHKNDWTIEFRNKENRIVHSISSNTDEEFNKNMNEYYRIICHSKKE